MAGGAASQLQREKMANQEAGMYGLEGLKAQDQAEAAAMYGLGPSRRFFMPQSSWCEPLRKKPGAACGRSE